LKHPYVCEGNGMAQARQMPNLAFHSFSIIQIVLHSFSIDTDRNGPPEKSVHVNSIYQM